MRPANASKYNTKRKASSSSSQGSERNRLRCQSQAATLSLHDYALKTNDDSQLVEIEQIPQDTQHSRSDYINKGNSISNVLQFSMPMLVHQSLRDSIYISGRAFLRHHVHISSRININPVLFCDRILQRANDQFSHGKVMDQSYLALIDWHHDKAVASALEFMSLATERRPELLEKCAQYTILFTE
jgi:hypothetical protein